MNKELACFLFDKGWSQAKVARKLGVDRSLVCRVVNRVRRMKKKENARSCEVCKEVVLRDLHVGIDGVDFLVCNNCQEELTTLVDS